MKVSQAVYHHLEYHKANSQKNTHKNETPNRCVMNNAPYAALVTAFRISLERLASITNDEGSREATIRPGRGTRDVPISMLL